VGEFTVLRDPEAEGPGPYGETFTYVLFVRSPKGEDACFRFAARPVGSFFDQRFAVPASITDGQREVRGDLTLTLHNTDQAPHYLSAVTLDAPAAVSLLGDSEIWLRLENLLADVPLAISEVEALRPASILRQATAQSHLGTRMLAGGEAARAVTLVVEPIPHRALGRSIFPLASTEAHEAITLLVRYHTPSGVERVREISVPIRFRPSIWSLAGIVAVGGVAGSLLGLAQKPRPGKPPRRQIGQWLKAALIAIILAFIAEAVGIVLQGEMTILGHSADPYQLLTAWLIGALVGAFGFRGLEILRIGLPPAAPGDGAA
jgi:hypothetical protein